MSARWSLDACRNDDVPRQLCGTKANSSSENIGLLFCSTKRGISKLGMCKTRSQRGVQKIRSEKAKRHIDLPPCYQPDTQLTSSLSAHEPKRSKGSPLTGKEIAWNTLPTVCHTTVPTQLLLYAYCFCEQFTFPKQPRTFYFLFATSWHLPLFLRHVRASSPCPVGGRPVISSTQNS